MKAASIVIIGAGGHAKVVLSSLQSNGFQVAAILDDNPATWGRQISGVPVSGPLASLQSNRYEMGVIAIGDNATRRQVARTFRLSWMTVVHPAAVVHHSVQLGPGTVVLAGAVLQPDTVLGEHVIINTGATVDHDCTVGNYSHLAPGVHLAGGVRVGEGTLLGIASAVIPGIQIGSWATLGAGGVAVRNLPDGVIAVGVPARPR